MFGSQLRAQENNQETDLLISIRLLKRSNTSNEIMQLIDDIVLFQVAGQILLVFPTRAHKWSLLQRVERVSTSFDKVAQ